MFTQTTRTRKLLAVIAAVSAVVTIQTAVPLTAFAAGSSSYSTEERASGGSSEFYGTGKITANTLRVRSEPNANSKVLTAVTKGHTLTLIGKQGKWYKIRYQGKDAWVCGDYLKVTASAEVKERVQATSTASTTASTTAKAAKTAKTTKATTTKAPASASSGKGTCKITASYLYVRSGPDKSYDTIGGLAKGSVVQSSGVQNGWYKITFSGKTGWIYKSYVKFEAGATVGKTETTTAAKKTTTTKKTTTRKTTTTAARNNGSSGKSTSASGRITIAISQLNARADASTSSEKIGEVRRNEVYTYTAIKNGWYKIQLPSGKIGYVLGDYVKPFNGYAVSGGGSYLWPTQTATRISSRFGPRDGRNHYGIDIAAPGGSQIIAVASGRVTGNYYDAVGFGNYIVITQNDGVKAYYAHMQKRSFVPIGTTVKAGQTIGIVGTTGRSTGNHLHLEFRRDGVHINPLNFYPNMR